MWMLFGTDMLPDEGFISPVIIRSRVDLPAPFLPTNPIRSRLEIRKLISLNRVNPPKLSDTWLTEIISLENLSPQNYEIQRKDQGLSDVSNFFL
jgi:hypothetical protein